MANGFTPHSKDAGSKDHTDGADWYRSCQQLVRAVRSMPMYKTVRLIGLYWLDQCGGCANLTTIIEQWFRQDIPLCVLHIP
jgi:hypothetical protein